MAVRLLSKRAVVMARKKVSKTKTIEKSDQSVSCPHCQGRAQTLPGQGDPQSKLVFVGEASGSENDPAESLLTKMIEAMGWSRERVYLLNLTRPHETQSICESCLNRQFESLNPSIVVALGQFASQALLKTTVPISELRGSFHPFRGAQLMSTFHPAYLLRSPSAKKTAWEDLKKVVAELGKR